jgi:hypothetical protein
MISQVHYVMANQAYNVKSQELEIIASQMWWKVATFHRNRWRKAKKLYAKTASKSYNFPPTNIAESYY